MNNLREYASTAAYTADSTREYPTVSYIDNVGIKYEEKPPVLRLGTHSNLSAGPVIIASFDPDVITKWPNIEIDNTNAPSFHFSLQGNNFHYLDTYSGTQYEYYLEKVGNNVKSTFYNNGKGESGYTTYDSEGNIVDSQPVM